jgi:aminobenzoyl-glutamate transport protein
MRNFLPAIRRGASRMFAKSLDFVEFVGNKLPHPATLFLLLAVLVMVVSWIAYQFGVQANHPVDGRLITVNNLISGDGFRWIYTNILTNFLEFPPLGFVLVVMVGIGVAEGSGLITVLIKALVLSSPPRLVTTAILTAGIVSTLAIEAGYVVLIPLSAMIFHALGRHPMAGLAAAFCGVSGGFAATFFISSTDTILTGITLSAAQMIIPEMILTPAVNFYFMFISSFVVIAVGVFVTERIVEPRLGPYTGNAERMAINQLSPLEKKGLRWAGYGLLGLVALLALSVIPEWGVFRNPVTGDALDSPFFGGIIIGILLMFLIPGLLYGIVVGTIKNDKQVVKHMTQTMAGMAGYIVLVFFAAQFVYFFRYSNLGIIFAINGAYALQSVGFTGIALIVSFVALSGFTNLFMGSASAKWAIMAPVFVPMFMLLDPAYHPALTQAAFRVGDSITNLITPMMSYFALIVTFAQKYDEKYGIGTIISTMLPYSVLLFIAWTFLLMVWMWIGVPLGPGGPIFMN